VIAVDSGGRESNPSDEVTATPVAPNIAPAAPHSLTAASGDAQVELSWASNSEADMTDGSYVVHRSTTRGFTPSSTTQLATVSHTGNGEAYTDDGDGALPAPANGTMHYYRVVAADPGGLDSEASDAARALPRAAAVPVSLQRSFAGGESGDYRLVALPGAADDDVASYLEGSTWRLFWDDGSTSDYLQPYEDSDRFRFSPGRGFWLLRADTWRVDDTFPTVTLRDERAAIIPLHEGWNIISNPLEETVDWERVQIENEVSQPIWSFDGDFTQTFEFRTAATGRAYYFYNQENLDSLAVPHPAVPGTALPLASAKRDGRADAAPSLPPPTAHLRAIAGEDTSTVRFGTDASAREDVARWDVLAPPTRFSDLQLRIRPSLVHHSRNSFLAQDVRAPQPDGVTISLVLHARPHTDVTLQPSNLEALGDQNAVLLDPTASRSYPLQGSRSEVIQIESDSVRTLRVAVGTEAYVKRQSEQVIPKTISLKAYPNPVQDRATFRLDLPEAADVRLEVFDLLGRRVAVVEDRSLSTGTHRIPWTTNQLSSGTYFLRGRISGTDERVITRRVTVVR
jgi:hypothetical protein